MCTKQDDLVCNSCSEMDLNIRVGVNADQRTNRRMENWMHTLHLLAHAAATNNRQKSMAHSI